MVTNIAHRGARSLAPENTLAGARKAKEIGADLWETDIAVTKDDQLILFHDDSLVRTTDARERFPDRAPWNFADFTLEEIRSLDAGSWFARSDPFGQVAAGAVSEADAAAYAGERVPTLREALLFTQEAGWRVNIELKRLPAAKADFPVAERVLALARELGIDKRHFLISSIRHDWLRRAEELAPGVEVQALMGLLPSDPMDWSGHSFKTYNVRHTRTDAGEVRSLVKKGHAVNLYVVNEEPDMRRFIAAGAAGLITDFPQRLKGLLDG